MFQAGISHRVTQYPVANDNDWKAVVTMKIV
jgi:hypothetical protein